MAQSLADAECALPYQEPFLLAKVPMERPAVAATTRLNFGPQKIPARFENYRVQIERVTLDNITGRNRLASLISGRGHRTPITVRSEKRLAL